MLFNKSGGYRAKQTGAKRANHQRDPRQMLRVLARLARLVKDSTFLERIRKAETPGDLMAVFGDLAG